ncbi:MAG: SufD family Fe-S cluster assembly protein [Candidatus Absconditabacterales bacterium]
MVKNKSKQIIQKITDFEGKKDIFLESETDLNYLFIGKGNNIDINIKTKGENISLNFYGIFFSDKVESKNKIKVKILNNDVKINVYLLSIVGDNGNLTVDGGIFVESGLKKCVGSLIEENIVLGKNIKIKTLPILDVKSKDVQMSHGAKIQKIDQNKLFYMGTKGISKLKSKNLILNGYFNNILENFNLINNKEIDGILKFCEKSSKNI